MGALVKLFGIGKSLIRLRPFMRGGRYLYGSVILTATVAAVLEAAALGLLGGVVLVILKAGAIGGKLRWIERWSGPTDSFNGLAFLAAVALAAMIAKNGALYVSSRLGTILKRRVAVNLRESLFSHLLRAPLRVFEERKAGEISSAVFNDTQRALTALETAVLATQRGSMALAYVGVLFFVSWPLALVAILLTVGLIAPVVRVHRRISELGAANLREFRRLIADLTESLAGVRVTRAANAQEQQLKRVGIQSRTQAEADERYARLAGLLQPLLEVLAGAAVLAILLAASRLTDQGLLEPDQLLTFGLVLMRLLPIINQLNNYQVALLYHGASLSSLQSWFALPTYPERPFGQRTFEGLRKGLRFESVGLTYETGRAALNDVSFEVPAGQMVALVGASGSGKSTAAALLLRLRAPTAGHILIDGVDHWEFTAESWHHRVAIVEQDAFLFNDTVAANITYGAPDATPADVADALRAAHLTDVILSLPQGLDTPVGERGVSLSGGQRQRLAIARALVRRPEVLVLDEATSALDTVSERHIQQALEAARRDRTVLVIAHRLSTIRSADSIVVMDDGRVVEHGSWDELVGRDGAFARLVRSNATPSGTDSDFSVPASQQNTKG